MSPDPIFWLAVAGWVVTCLAAIGAGSLAEFSPHELKEICRRRDKPDRLGQILRQRDQVALAAETLRIVGATAMIGAGAFWTWTQAQAEGTVDWRLLAAALAGGVLLLLAADIWIPWAFLQLWADPFLYYTWPAWRAVGVLLFPLVLGAHFTDAIFHRLAGRLPEVPDEESFEDDIRTIVTQGHREGLLEEDAREMIEGVMELGDADVAKVMTPRTEIVCMPRSLSWQEALDFVCKAGHTRIPVYSRSRDDVVGILHAKDLLPELAKPPSEPKRPWTELLREPYFVPETKPIDTLLQEFQRTRNHMAVVLDEYGGVAGLVSLEDVLEEIVGEIADEYDKDLVEGIRLLGEGVCEALGNVHIDEINERFHLDLPEDGDFDTIAGLVFSGLGRIPKVDEELVTDGVRITVLEATPRRIQRVRVEVIEQQ